MKKEFKKTFTYIIFYEELNLSNKKISSQLLKIKQHPTTKNSYF